MKRAWSRSFCGALESNDEGGVAWPGVPRRGVFSHHEEATFGSRQKTTSRVQLPSNVVRERIYSRNENERRPDARGNAETSLLISSLTPMGRAVINLAIVLLGVVINPRYTQRCSYIFIYIFCSNHTNVLEPTVCDVRRRRITEFL